ncbi:MAG: hypothetical protein ACPGWS_09380 [Solirubrobacterales bacterium]
MPLAIDLSANTLTVKRTVATSDTATKGMALIADSDTTVDDAPAGSDLAMFVAKETKTAGERVECFVLGTGGVIPVLVGTGGATVGLSAKLAADGFTDASTHDSDGGGEEATYGKFLESGTAGQFVGMINSGFSVRGV